MTVQNLNNFLSVTSSRTARGMGAQYRAAAMQDAMLQRAFNAGNNMRVGLRQKGQIDWSRLERQNVYYKQDNNENSFNWKACGRSAISYGGLGAGIGLVLGGPVGAAIGAGAGALFGGIKNAFFS